jgi:pyruvate/2-oxoglutarate dehydrogenase complex dihydrolipoamide dehydrogenase (E3) component
LIVPDDEFNRTWLQNVRPFAWVNPRPSGRYNLVVIGAGTAGLVAAAIAAGLGARVALIEKERMGGDCLNFGCVPSKALVRASRVWAESRRLGEFGVQVDPAAMRYEFGAAMARMRRLRAKLSSNDSSHRFAGLSVDVFFGAAKFTGPETIQVGQIELWFARAAVCTGSRPATPEIAGLEAAGYLTNETVFNLTELPPRLAVIGAGPIGCELAQAFARFGSRVTVIEQSAQILPREDADAAAILQAQMQADGVSFVLNAKTARVKRQGSVKLIQFDGAGEHGELAVDEILVGVGRTPNVEGLGLDVVGVDHGVKSGVEVDKHLRTTNPRIFAAGDVCFPFRFTHVADALAQILVQNALFPHPLGVGLASTEKLVIPWCTYTDPEIAHVGLTEKDADAREIAIDTFTVNLAEVDRAVLDGQEQGFARVHVKKGTDRILGATIVAAHAGEMISELTLLMNSGRGLATLARTIHPYPTQIEAVKKLATAWRKATLTSGRKSLLAKFFALIR